MGTPEDTALHGLRVSVGHILDHFGFTQISDDSMDVLSDIMRRFIKKLASNGKIYAEHAGRTQMSSDDLFCAFKKLKYSPVELHHFFAQNHLTGTNKHLARFPVPRAHPRALFHPQPSEKELENRPEHIPRFLQAAHPEWTREGADYLAVMKPSTSNEKKGAAPDFPCFMNFTSKDLGISKEDRKPAPPPLIRTDESSATGIRSSANLASAKLTNYDHPPAPPMFKRKTNKTLNGLKESRSSTPIGRSHSPYNFFDRTESMRTESPSTSREDKPKLKSRLSAKTERVESPMPPMTDEAGASSPMPTLELEGYAKDDLDPPMTPGGYDYDDNDNSFTFSDKSSPPPAADSKVAENILLFMRQKKANEEKELALAKEREKEKENEEKRRKKEEKKREAQKRKEEKKKEQERQKQLQKEKEEQEKRKRKDEAKLEKERKDKEQRAKKEREEAERKEKAEAERRRAAETSTPPMRMSEHDVKPLKLVISNPMSSNASSAFSPPTARAASHLDAARFATTTGEDDSDTIPFVEGTAVIQKGATEFPLNISISSTDSPSPKKKHKKKDKERDRSSSPHKKHKKKDKEHKKKKKKEKEREEEERKEKKKKKHHEEPVQEQKITLKIRLGEQSTSSADSGAPSSNHGHEPVKLKFKNILPDRAEEKVPILRLGMPSSVKEEKKQTPEKPKLVTKAELKAPASAYSSKSLSEKEEKQKRREERKRREREEAEQRQREELERLRKEHEEKLKREAEEKRREEELREAEEKRRRKEKEQREREQREREQREREQKEREQKEREEKERRDREKEAARREKEKEREKERQSTSSGHHDSHHKKKHKKEKREREEREEREREKERERIAREEKEQKKRLALEAARALELALNAHQGPTTSSGGGGGDDDDSCDDAQIWICPECSVAWAEGANMVCCDGCNNWFHWTCVGLIFPPAEDAKWFCRKCTKKNNKRPGAPPGGGGTGGGPPKKRRKGEGHEYLK